MRLTSARLGRLAAAGALLAATLMAAAPATATAAAAQGFGPLHVTKFGGNWGGYADTGASFTSVSGSWTEPSVTCTANHELYAPWVGIDGFNTQTVEQTGVQTSCATGKPVVSGWYEMFPAAPVYYSNPASIGDKFTASVVFNGGNSYTLTLTDVTKGWTQHVTKSLSASNASAEAIIEAPGGFPSIPNGVKFTNVMANGKLLNAFTHHKLTSAGFVPGPLNGGTFTIKHT
ncbi:MAG TPA: G1 family glutamic endopeptidase [Streptosporangiaceae bacterium]